MEKKNLKNNNNRPLSSSVSSGKGGGLGFSTHAVANNLSMQQELLRLEKTLKLRQKVKDLEEKLRSAALQN